jgi:hypothetical protein
MSRRCIDTAYGTAVAFRFMSIGYRELAWGLEGGEQPNWPQEGRQFA